jgi:hypothetical protein
MSLFLLKMFVAGLLSANFGAATAYLFESSSYLLNASG